MCNAKDWDQSPIMLTYRDCQQKQQYTRRCKVRVRCLVVRRKFERKRTDNMKLKNLQLYLENRSIFLENEKLQQEAIRLSQENQVLHSEYLKKIKTG